MSGRRLRYAINETLKAAGFPNNSQVVIAGLANTYADYIATFEEYAVQRYEGASTIYGPHTLDAYIDHYKKMAKDLASVSDCIGFICYVGLCLS
jgi:neutral ceramidase